MAKDKSKKAGKATTSDDFAKPSEAPAGGDGWKFAEDENDGKLFLFRPLRKEMVNTESYGEKEVIVADVVELNEKKPAKSEEHTEVFIFSAWVQGSLRAYIGERLVLGRLAKTPDKKSGKGYVWKLEDGDEADTAVAREYLASLDPFAAGGGSKPEKKGKKSKPEPEPEKKKAKDKGKKKK